MDIIEKEKVKEIPAECWNDKYGYNRFASKGMAGTALGLGIAGTALGLWNASGNGGFGLFGRKNGMPENVNINTVGSEVAPSPFHVWVKENEDILGVQKQFCNYALAQQSQRFSDRQTVDSELFGLYKSQVDADFGLYKTSRDSFDLTNNRITNEIFSLYKSTRDEDDSIRKELSDLKAQVAINTAIRPYQDKLIQCEIDKAFTAGINYTDKKTCNVLYGRVVMPLEPEIKGYPSYHPCGCSAMVEPEA